MPPSRIRYAIVGLGGRAEMYTRALATDYAEQAQLVAFCDVNQTRMDVHNAILVNQLGTNPVPTYRSVDFVAMIDRERVDAVIVTTVDRFHDEYIVMALHRGCNVITEKPMTIDVPAADEFSKYRPRLAGI